MIFSEPEKKLNIICGHYGSGKTNFAVNLALDIRRRVPDSGISIADLDIVNPYFRTADAVSVLVENNIEPLIPEFANTNVDIPSLPNKLISMIEGKGGSGISIIDVGGDDGTVVLGMYRDKIERSGYDMYYVVNMYRPLIAEPKNAYLCMKDIEEACGLRCTKLINNSCIGAETTAEDIADSIEYAKECSALCGIPCVAHSYFAELAPAAPEILRKRGYPDEVMFAMRNITKKLF